MKRLHEFPRSIQLVNDCLLHNHNTMDLKDNGAISEQVAETITMFIRNIGFSRCVSKPHDRELEAKALDKVIQLGLPPSRFDPLRRSHEYCCLLVTLCYGSYNMDIQVYVAVYSLLGMITDNLLIEPSAMQTFVFKFMNGEPQTDPYLGCLASLLATETPNYYGVLGTNMIMKSSIDSLAGICLEYALPKTGARPMKGFSMWMRSITSIGVAYAQFLFPTQEFPEECFVDYVQVLPNISEMVGFVNDILSFYKERVAASENCFLLYHSMESCCTELESLNWACDRVMVSHRSNLDFLATMKGQALDRYMGFVMGYIEWHFRIDRYKLEEIGLTLADGT